MNSLTSRVLGSIFAAYTAFAPPAFAAPRFSSSAELHGYGIKDGKYQVEATLTLKNEGAAFPTEFSWLYSLCFGPTEQLKDTDPHIQPGCYDGGQIEAPSFGAGQQSSKRIKLVKRGSASLETALAGGKVMTPIRGLKPHISIQVERADGTYVNDVVLPPVGVYVTVPPPAPASLPVKK